MPFLCSWQVHKLISLGRKPVSGSINCFWSTSVQWSNPCVGALGLKHQRHLPNRNSETERGSLGIRSDIRSFIHWFTHSFIQPMFIEYLFYSGQHVSINYIWNTHKSPPCPCVGWMCMGQNCHCLVLRQFLWLRLKP